MVRLTVVTAVLLSLVLAWCVGCGGNSDPPTGPGRLRVVTTTPMLGDLARQIGGDHVEVTNLIGEGVDPHLFKPTRTDIEAITSADLLVTNGLFLEGRMLDAFGRARDAGRRVVFVGDGIPKELLLYPEGTESHPDPHIWMDPVLWSTAAEVLCAALSEADAPHAADYLARRDRFIALSQGAEDRAAAAIGSIPGDRRILVTAHDAFAYYGRRFGLEVHGIQGISTESEAGLADLERLVELLVARRIPAVFVESTVSPRTVEALVAGAQAKGHTVRIGGELFSDSMGKAGTPEGTWIGMLEHNTRTMVEALGGTMPPSASGAAEPAHAP